MGTIWDHMGPIWAHMGPYGPLWAHMGLYTRKFPKILRKFLGIPRDLCGDLCGDLCWLTLRQTCSPPVLRPSGDEKRSGISDVAAIGVAVGVAAAAVTATLLAPKLLALWTRKDA